MLVKLHGKVANSENPKLQYRLDSYPVIDGLPEIVVVQKPTCSVTWLGKQGL